MIFAHTGLQNSQHCLDLSAALRHFNVNSNGQRSSHMSILYPTEVLSLIALVGVAETLSTISKRNEAGS